MVANYMACLAHFCELHGPSMIMCTQKAKFREKSDYLLTSTSKLQTCLSCKLMLPKEAINVVTDVGRTGGRSETVGEDEVWVSTCYPSSQQRYAALTKLVMKSLSVETTTDISKPIFYGDGVNGYCISKIFKTSDLNARGSERKYSLMVVSDSELDLVGKWDVIGAYLLELISLIQLQVDTASHKSVGAASSTDALMAGDLLDNERYLRRSMIKPKSLVELTNDPQLFVKIHLWAIELLNDLS